MLTKKEKVIDGIPVEVTPFPVWRAFEIKLRLAKKFIPGIMAMAGAGDSVLDVNVSQFMTAIDGFLQTVEPSEFMRLVSELCEWVEVKNEKGEKRFLAPGKEINESILNDLFCGKITTLYKILFFVLEVNYPDFFALGGRLGK
jgi:hypothetical protein